MTRHTTGGIYNKRMSFGRGRMTPPEGKMVCMCKGNKHRWGAAGMDGCRYITPTSTEGCMHRDCNGKLESRKGHEYCCLKSPFHGLSHHEIGRRKIANVMTCSACSYAFSSSHTGRVQEAIICVCYDLVRSSSTSP